MALVTVCGSCGHSPRTKVRYPTCPCQKCPSSPRHSHGERGGGENCSPLPPPHRGDPIAWSPSEGGACFTALRPENNNSRRPLYAHIDAEPRVNSWPSQSPGGGARPASHLTQEELRQNKGEERAQDPLAGRWRPCFMGPTSGPGLSVGLHPAGSLLASGQLALPFCPLACFLEEQDTVTKQEQVVRPVPPLAPMLHTPPGKKAPGSSPGPAPPSSRPLSVTGAAGT